MKKKFELILLVSLILSLVLLFSTPVWDQNTTEVLPKLKLLSTLEASGTQSAIASESTKTPLKSEVIDISGLWLTYHPNHPVLSDQVETLRIFQNGKKIMAVLVQPSSKLMNVYGYRQGDLLFYGKLERKLLRGKIVLHFPINYKSLCPKQWQFWDEIELTVSENANTLQGRRNYHIIHDDCTVTTSRWQPINMTRLMKVLEVPKMRLEESVSEDDFAPFAEGKPEKIFLLLDKLSAMVGQAINLEVYLVNSYDQIVVADKSYQINLQASGGEVRPNVVNIPQGGRLGVAKVNSDQPRDVVLHASSEQPLKKATKICTYCTYGEIHQLTFSSGREQAPIGIPIEARLRFTDANGTPVSDGKPKSIEYQYEGVGQIMLKGPDPIPDDQCACEIEVISNRPGEATVLASLGTTLEKERHFSFFVPLSLWLFVIVSFGGIGGAFVRSATTWSKSKRWSAIKWAVYLTSGALVGICLFLVYYYGFLQLTPSFPGGMGLGFLLGLVGGYLGPVAMDRIAAHILPPNINRG